MNNTLRTVIDGIEDKKAKDVVVLDISRVSSFTDYFVLCTGNSTRHMQALADTVGERAKETGVSPTHVEGYQHAEWILMDFLDFVVHIFSPTSRTFYDLERLWCDGQRVGLPVRTHSDNEMNTHP